MSNKVNRKERQTESTQLASTMIKSVNIATKY